MCSILFNDVHDIMFNHYESTKKEAGYQQGARPCVLKNSVNENLPFNQFCDTGLKIIEAGDIAVTIAVWVCPFTFVEFDLLLDRHSGNGCGSTGGTSCDSKLVIPAIDLASW